MLCPVFACGRSLLSQPHFSIEGEIMLGENIKKRRLELNMTQKTLSNGICTQSQISKIEKNEIIPLSNLLLSISKKLNISMDKLMDYSIDETVNKNEVNQKLFDQLLISRDYNMIDNLLESIDYNNLSENDKIYYRWLYLLMDNILRNIAITKELNELFNQYENIIDNELKINILNSIGVQSRKEHKYNESKKAFEKALNYKGKYINNKLVVKVLYNMSNLLFDLEKWEELMDVLDDTMIYVYQYHQYEILPELIYSKYYCMKKLGITYLNKEEITTAKFIAKKLMRYDILKLLNEL